MKRIPLTPASGNLLHPVDKKQRQPEKAPPSAQPEQVPPSAQPGIYLALKHVEAGSTKASAWRKSFACLKFREVKVGASIWPHRVTPTACATEL